MTHKYSNCACAIGDIIHMHTHIAVTDTVAPYTYRDVVFALLKASSYAYADAVWSRLRTVFKERDFGGLA